MKNRRGCLSMFAGLLLLAAALLLTLYNVLEQQQAAQAADAILAGVTEQIEEAAPESEPLLVAVDARGNELNWPKNELGEPIAWAVDEEGQPVESMQDASGEVYVWSEITGGELMYWTQDRNGSLLPWIRNESGQIIAWPVSESGEAVSWDYIGQTWNQIVESFFPYLRDTLHRPDFVLHPDMQMPEREIDGEMYIGVLDIPKLRRSLPVVSEWNYAALKKAPCRYTGSVYSGDIVICAHNYERHFGGIGMLSEGDEVRFTDMKGNVFLYEVCGQEMMDESNVERMKGGEWDLTMFTCTMGGTKRVAIRCRQVDYIWNEEQ